MAFERKVRRGFAKVAEDFSNIFCGFCVILAAFAFKKTSKTQAGMNNQRGAANIGPRSLAPAFRLRCLNQPWFISST